MRNLRSTIALRSAASSIARAGAGRPPRRFFALSIARRRRSRRRRRRTSRTSGCTMTLLGARGSCASRGGHLRSQGLSSSTASRRRRCAVVAAAAPDTPPERLRKLLTAPGIHLARASLAPAPLLADRHAPRARVVAPPTSPPSPLLTHAAGAQGPCAHDGLSARLIERAGFPFMFMSGFCVSASQLGMPDAGLMSCALPARRPRSPSPPTA